jgi:outer membrane protein OmpA-like peptidoglycan-associated protein
MKFLLTLLFSISVLCSQAQEQFYVLFEYDKAHVPDTAMARLVKTIYSNNVLNIYLEGHCDSIGSKRYNYALSKRRVRAVKQILIDNGYDKNNIEGMVGFGKDKPLASNSDAESRQKNRRVLVRFVVGEEPIKSKSNPTSTAQLQKEKNRKTDTSITFKKIKVSDKKSDFLISNPKKNKKKKVLLKTNNSRPKIIKAAKKPKALKPENFTPNTTIALPNLLFQGGRHFLVSASNPSLKTLIAILKNKPEIKVEIQGHVCCTTYQDDGYDWDTRTHNLSVTRARAIKAFLVKNGISSTRLKIKGFGGSRKLFPMEENIYQRQQNRRVEIMVLPN